MNIGINCMIFEFISSLLNALISGIDIFKRFKGKEKHIRFNEALFIENGTIKRTITIENIGDIQISIDSCAFVQSDNLEIITDIKDNKIDYKNVSNLYVGYNKYINNVSFPLTISPGEAKRIEYIYSSKISGANESIRVIYDADYRNIKHGIIAITDSAGIPYINAPKKRHKT